MPCKACKDAKEIDEMLRHHSKGPSHETFIKIKENEATHLRQWHCTCDKPSLS